MYVSKYTTKLVLNSWLSFDWNTYDYVHISSTIEIYSGVLSGVEKVPFLLRRAGVEKVQDWGLSTTLDFRLNILKNWREDLCTKVFQG